MTAVVRHMFLVEDPCHRDTEHAVLAESLQTWCFAGWGKGCTSKEAELQFRLLEELWERNKPGLAHCECLVWNVGRESTHGWPASSSGYLSGPSWLSLLNSGLTAWGKVEQTGLNSWKGNPTHVMDRQCRTNNTNVGLRGWVWITHYHWRKSGQELISRALLTPKFNCANKRLGSTIVENNKLLYKVTSEYVL